MTGKLLGNYEILDKLGQGGMGEVWRARDQRLHRMVAIKILPQEVSGDPARQARFEQEARALALLNHPNIVTVYDVGQDGERAYIVSELVEGESLRQVLDRGPLPVRKAIEIAVQMAEGMAAAHALGIVHRDLKPENVMVARTGQVKLLDFGLAKQSPAAVGDMTSTMALSQPGTVLGTAGYMSPEQVRAEPVDPRSDIFSFGCVLYEMISGRRAFQAASGVETMHAVLNAEPPEFEGQQTKMPLALATIVRRCLEKRPEQRFQSSADLAFALRSITSTSVTGAQAAVAASRRAPKPWMWLATAILVAAVLFIAGYFLRERTLHRGQTQFQRITFRKGYVTEARFTPDGNIVYAANWEGGPGRIYLAVPGSPESRDLGMPPESGLAAVSSKLDVALITGTGGDYGSGRLSINPISGGQTRPLLDGVLAADWAPDGSSMAVLRLANGANRLEYPIGNVLVKNVPWPLWMVRVSPDGSRVVYAKRFHGAAIELIVVDRTGKQQSLGGVSGQNSSGESSALSWSPKGNEIWFRSFDSGEPGIVYAVDMKGRRRIALSLPSRVKLYDISREGKALLVTGSAQLGILGQAPGDSVERDLSCLDSGQVAGISDDGQTIVANITGESGTPKGSIYLRKTDGTPAIRVGDGHAYKLSPDGGWISGYTLDNSGSRRFAFLPTGPGEEFAINVPGIPSAAGLGWLDGEQRFLVLGRNERKRFQCFAWDAGRGTVQPVCPEGTPDTLGMFVSPDRKQVLSPGLKGGWVVYPIDGGAVQEVHGIGLHEYPVGWRSDNHSLYVRPNQENTPNIPVSVLEIGTGKRSAWKEIRPSQPVVEVHDLHIAPDGRAYAYNYVLMQSDLYVAHGLY